MRNVFRILLPLGWVALAMAQSPATVALSAPATTVIAGNQLQISAAAADNTGRAVANPSFTWTSNNTKAATVDSSGKVTALLPAIVSITAAAGNARSSFQLQVVPLRIDVTPANQVLHIGDQLQYAAAVLDVNQQPLPVAVTWQLAGANGRNTSEGFLTTDGALTVYAVSNFTIRAVVPYPGAPADFLAQFVGETNASVAPPQDYTLRRMLTTDDTRQSFRLLARRGGIAVNDNEQLVTVAALDGLSSGVLTSDSSGFQILASGGTSTLNPGGNLIDFRDPVVNSSGSVLVRADAMNSAGGLLLVSKSQFQFLLTDGSSTGYTDFENTNVSRFSLNDAGAVVFQSSYLPFGSTTRANALFDIQKGNVNLDVSSPGTALPGLNAGFFFDADYGMDGQGNVYFGASDGTNHAVFRVAPDTTVTKVLAIGDRLGASTVANISRFGIDTAGDLAIGGIRADNAQFLVRYPGGNLSAAPDLLPLNSYSQVFGINAAGVLFLGDAGRGWGLYLWPPKSSSANAVLLQGSPAPAGDVILEIQAAAMTSAGVVFAKIRTAGQPLQMLRIAASGTTVLFQSGDRLAVTANLTLRGLVAGANAGDAHPLMGGFQSSVFQLSDTTGLVPRVLVGDRFNALPFYGNYNPPAVKSPDGSLYVTTDDGVFRPTASATSLVFSAPRNAPDGVTEFSPNLLAANDSGALASVSSTNQNHSRLVLRAGGALQILAYIGANPSYRTSSPAGGYFSAIQELAIDANGRVMARFTVTGGPSGYFLWSGGQWNAAALFGQTLVNGQIVDGGPNLLRAGGPMFYAVLNLRGSTTFALAQFDGVNWNPLVLQGYSLPDGGTVGFIRDVAANRIGDVAYVGDAGGYSEIVVQTAGGANKLVWSGAQPLPDGSFLASFPQIEFRDDHRVFFLAFDFLDRVNLYVAQPNF